jgi:Protein of unknown function (DUF3102)
MNEIVEIDRRRFAAMLKDAGGNLKKVSIPPALSNRRSADEFVRLITDHRTHAVENLVAIGQHLRDAKEELDHGEFGPMLKRIKFSGPTARKYMDIAAHPVISNCSNWNVLPPSWTTLYALSTLSPEVLEARIADGTITPDFEGTAVASLKGAPAGSPKRCRVEERVAELEAELKAVRETARDRERELQRENDLLRSEVGALRAELGGREASQSQSAPAPAARDVEPMTDEDRQRLEGEGQQRLPLGWEREEECPRRLCTSQEVARNFSVAAE